MLKGFLPTRGLAVILAVTSRGEDGLQHILQMIAGFFWRARNTFAKVFPEQFTTSRTSDNEFCRSRSAPATEVEHLLDLEIMVDMYGPMDASRVLDRVAPAMFGTSSSESNEVSQPTARLTRTPLHSQVGPALADISNAAVVRRLPWAGMTNDPDPANQGVQIARISNPVPVPSQPEPESEPDPETLQGEVLLSTWPFE